MIHECTYFMQLREKQLYDREFPLIPRTKILKTPKFNPLSQSTLLESSIKVKGEPEDLREAKGKGSMSRSKMAMAKKAKERRDGKTSEASRGSIQDQDGTT